MIKIKNKINKFEAFLRITLKSKKNSMGILFLLLIIPLSIRYFFIFLLATKLLPDDLFSKRIKKLLPLGFSRGELFLFSVIFGLFIVVTASLIFNSMVALSINFENLLKSITFFLYYFSFSMFSICLKGGKFLIPSFVFVFDIVYLSFSSSQSIFAKISPIQQSNIFLAFLFSLLLLIFSYFLFTTNRNEKW